MLGTCTGAYVRRARGSLAAGVAFTALGVVVLLAVVYFQSHAIEWHRLLLSLSMLAIGVGVVMGGISLLAMKGRSIEEAYRLGYDLGFEKGHQWANHEDERITRYLDEHSDGDRPKPEAS
jgi:hypothetical protein